MIIFVSPSATSRRASAPEEQTDPDFRLDANPDEIGHLVCCRDPSWRTSFCGAENETINVAVEMICSMCMERVEAMWPGWREDPEMFCPVDGQACPDEHTTGRRITRETGPPMP